MRSVRGLRVASGLGLLLPVSIACAASDDPIADLPKHDAAHRESSVVPEIIVSARRKTEKLQDVPLSVLVRSGEELDRSGSVRAQEMLQGVPNVTVESLSPRQTSLVMRGLGKNPANDGLEPSVGVYLDGVNLARSGMVIADLADLERIEVLRGPQGTLFGKNVSAGVLNLLSRSPTDAPEAYVDATFGSSALRQLRAVASGPVAATSLSYRVTGTWATREGFTQGAVTGKDLGEIDRLGIRGQLRWNAESGSEIRVIADYSAFDEDAPGYLLVNPGVVLENGSIRPNNFLDRTARAGYTPRFDAAARRSFAESEQRLAGEQMGVSVQSDWRLGEHTLTSITAWRGWNSRPRTDGDLTPLAIQPELGFSVRHRQASQEFRLASASDGPFEYVAGIYFFGQQLTSTFVSRYGEHAADFAVPGLDPRALDGVRVQTVSTPDVESFAGFLQGSIDLSPRAELTLGVRATRENKSANIRRTSSGGTALQQNELAARRLREQLGGATDIQESLEEDLFSGLVSASYRFDSHTLGYASMSWGSKSGGINAAVVAEGAAQVVSSELVRNAELGLKGQWLEGRLSLDLAAYHMEVDDYQATVRDPLRAASLLANAEAVKSQGIELETRWQVSTNLQLRFAVGWADARFESFRNATCPAETVGRTTCDVSGMRIPGAAPFTFSGHLNYAVSIGKSLQLSMGADFAHTDAFRTELSHYTHIDAHDVVDARVGLGDRDGRWSISVWSRNVFDEDYFTALTNAGVFNSGVVYGLAGDPRTIGVSVRLAHR